jgi:hypothetical protein
MKQDIPSLSHTKDANLEHCHMDKVPGEFP